MRTNLGIAVEMGEPARGAQIKRGTTETETAKTPEPGSMPERKLKPERSSRSCASQAGALCCTTATPTHHRR